MRPVLSVRFLVGVLFILTALSPIMMVHNPIDNSPEVNENDKSHEENKFGVPVLKDPKPIAMQARGQPCPAAPLQNDGGQPGDAGNNSTGGERPIGANPVDSFMGCVDLSDNNDWYEFTLDEGYNVEVEMSNFDFDYDILLGIENKSNPGEWLCVDCYGGATYDAVEKVSSFGTPNESEAGLYVILIYPYNQQTVDQGDYQIDIWSNRTELCKDWYPTQDDAGTGRDAPANWTDSPTNMGSNITASYTGCIDSIDDNDVFAFDVPENHTIDARITMEAGGHDIDIYLQSNETYIDQSYVDQETNPSILEEEVTTKGTNFADVGGTYFINLSNWAKSGNYTLEVWTNYTVPTPNLAIGDITFNLSTDLGETIPITVGVLNDGSIGTTESFSLEVILSEDTGITMVDHYIGNTTWSSGIAINETENITLDVTIPTNLVEGEYYVFVEVDINDSVVEKNEEDNLERASNQIAIGTANDRCAIPQNDAATLENPPGGDVGDQVSNSSFLGLDPDVEVRGCVDADDVTDLYAVNITKNEQLNITLVSPPIDNADFDMQLELPNGTVITSSTNSSNLDDFMTLEGTDYQGQAGTYYINVSYYEGGFNTPSGTYRLLVGEPDQTAYVPPFSCGAQNDLGLGGDASSAGPIGTLGVVGETGSYSGIGCLGGGDDEDVYEFRMGEEYMNVEVSFNSIASNPFTAVLQNSDGDIIASVDNTSYGLMFASFGNETYEGQDTTYTIVVSSNGGEGTYEVDLEVVAPALPDLMPDFLSCPTYDHETGEDMIVSWKFSNQRGPGLAQEVLVEVELIDQDSITVATIYSSELDAGNLSLTDDFSYNYTYVQDDYRLYTIPEDISSGDYRCRLIIDSREAVVEENEANNIHITDAFYIQNEAEFWANDIDRDGYNTTDMGDGNIDDCPDISGTSTIDRYGCPDLDNDGVSNDNDILPSNPSQWYDTDGDGFGDNDTGLNGDQCPNVAGIADIDGPGPHQSGCPDIDNDKDGVPNDLDQCPNTSPNAEVDDEGCEFLGGTGDNNSGTDGTNGDTDGTTSSDNSGSSDDTSDASDKAESESGLFGMSYTVIGIIGVAVVLVLLTLLFVRGRGSKSDAYTMQEKAYADAGLAAAASADSPITPEQQQYEQQLIDAGYPADYARAYADQHFRPWLNQ